MGHKWHKFLLVRAIQLMVFATNTALRTEVGNRRNALGAAWAMPPAGVGLAANPYPGPMGPGVVQQCIITVDGMTCMMEQHSRRFSDTPRTSYVNDSQPFRGSQCP